VEIMTLSNSDCVEEPDTQVQKRITELEKGNWLLRAEIERIKLKDKVEARITLRNNRILEGINRIFSIVVQEVTGSKLGFVNLVGDDGITSRYCNQ
jgi:hypothetical protein